jgi:predicted MFS family arabinose efflux permease
VAENQTRYGIAALAMGSQAAVIGLLTPIYFGMLVRQIGLDTQQLGMIASFEKVGGILVILMMAWFISRLNLRLITIIGLILLIGGTLACAFTRDFEVLLALRIVVGIATSVATAAQTAYFAAMVEPERWFAWRVTLTILLTMVGLSALPYIEAQWGMTGFYIALLAPAPIWIWSIFALPAKPPAREAIVDSDRPHAEPARTNLVYIGLSLLAVAFFGSFITPVYDFSERYGDAIGMSPQNIGWVLSATTAIGLLGSLPVSFIGSRFGRIKPLIGGTILALACCLILALDYDITGFFIAMALFSIVWSFNTPYLLGLIAIGDKQGRWTIVASAFADILRVPTLILFGWIIATVGLHGGAVMAASLATLSLMFACGAILYQKASLSRSGKAAPIVQQR